MDEEYGRYLHLRRQRFTTVVYVATLVFILVSIVQWLPMKHVDIICNFFREYSGLNVGFFTAGLILLFFYIFFENLRLTVPWNVIFGLIIVECFVIGIAALVVRQHRFHSTFSFMIWFAVLFIFVLIGQSLPCDLTMYLPSIVLESFICLLVGLYSLMLHIVFNVAYSFYIYRVLIVICLLTFIMYHAQLIHGGRHAEFRPFDYWLGAFTLYFDYLLLYLFSFQVAPKWSDECNSNTTLHFIFDNHLPKFNTTY